MANSFFKQSQSDLLQAKAKFALATHLAHEAMVNKDNSRLNTTGRLLRILYQECIRDTVYVTFATEDNNDLQLSLNLLVCEILILLLLGPHGKFTTY